MCESDLDLSPALLAACLKDGMATFVYTNTDASPKSTEAYGLALQEQFSWMPTDPAQCVALIARWSKDGNIRVFVANAADDDHPGICPRSMEVTIQSVPQPGGLGCLPR